MKTAIIVAVMLGLAAAQQDGAYRGRPFQNSNAAYQQQPQQQQPQQPQQQQRQAQPVDNSQYQDQYQEPGAAAASAGRVDADRRSTTTPIPILQWNKQQEHDGTYRTSYETGNNIIAEESGYLKTFGEGEDQNEALVQQGSYSYTSPDGQLITVHYTADEHGFHATGDHIPTPPPVSEEIQKGLDLIYAGIRQQEEAAAREAAERPAGQVANSNAYDSRQKVEDDQSGRYRA